MGVLEIQENYGQMKIHTLERTQILNHPIEEVFDFFRSPENLGVITPRWLNFRILTPLPLVIREGTVLDYTVDWLGVPVRWTTIITSYKPPFQFVDQQVKGPYSFWHHTHTFMAKNRRTEMHDEVRYVLPFGVLGEIVHTSVVRWQLEKIFDYRANIIERCFPRRLRAEHGALVTEDGL